MLRYKFKVMEAVKEAGYTNKRLRLEKGVSESTMQKFREGIMVSPSSLDVICEILAMQPGDIIEWIPNKKEK